MPCGHSGDHSQIWNRLVFLIPRTVSDIIAHARTLGTKQADMIPVCKYYTNKYGLPKQPVSPLDFDVTLMVQVLRLGLGKHKACRL